MKWQSKPSAGILWPEIKNLDEKNAIATELANRAKDGDVIGVGSGSTAYLATLALGFRVRNEGLQIKVVSTSIESEMTCLDSGLETTTLLSHRPDWCFDGADEVDIQGNLNKGRGGAMLRERLIFEAAMRRYLIVDSSKFVEQLCTNFPIPFEIHPHAVQYFRDFITQRGHLIALRLSGGGKDGPVITESANLIVDVWFTGSARVQEAELASRVGGVFASGLFAHFDYELIGGAARWVIRAAVAHDVESARLMRAQYDAQVICFGERNTASDLAISCLETFLTTEFEGGRHEARVQKLNTVDEEREA